VVEIFRGLGKSVLIDLPSPFVFYEFQVHAENSVASVSSDWSRARSAEAAPGRVLTPTLVSATSSSLEVQLQPPRVPNGLITSYRVFVDNEQVLEVDEHGIFTIDGLKPYTSYAVHVAVCTSAGCGASGPADAMTSPGNPEGVATPVGVATSYSEVALSWAAPLTPNGPITAYEVAAASLYECPFETGQPDAGATEPTCHFLTCAKHEDVCGSRCFDPAETACCDGALFRKLGSHVCCGTKYSKVGPPNI
jgi:hypothetical protein